VTTTTDPTTGLPLYTFDGSGVPDLTVWTAVTDVTGPNSETLYTFDADTAGQPPTGVVTGTWDLFTGTPAPVGTTTPPTPPSPPTPPTSVDFVLQDNQNVDFAVQLLDGAGNIVPGVTADAGSVTATGSDGGTDVLVTVSADGSSVNARAVGPEVTGVVITVAASVAGTALTPGTQVVDVSSSPVARVGLVAGTPQINT
jgi:hypothetical protein